MADDELWTVQQTMDYLALGRSTVYAMMAAGDLVRVHVGTRRTWVLAASVRALRDRAVSAATPADGLPLGAVLAARDRAVLDWAVIRMDPPVANMAPPVVAAAVWRAQEATVGDLEGPEDPEGLEAAG